jgi:hypothetical protein
MNVPAFSLNTWYNVVFTRNGSNDIKTYINGIYVGSCSLVANEDFILNGFGGFTSFTMNGKIDDIRIYNRELTSSEIILLQSDNDQIPAPLNKWQNNSTDLFFNGAGNIGIGTNTPAAKLTVNGPILSTEVKVKIDISTYPDFVFAPDYKLKTLKDVELYINEKGHLPEIPKAKDVKEGINLGAMNIRLLQKIEELTLYTIEQAKSIEELKQSIKEQNEKIVKLESIFILVK